MTKDYMKRASMDKWTACDFGAVAYRRGEERKLQKQIKRSVRRINKISLKKFEDCT